ncbi:hypothetical protein QA600_13440 [Natronococcus sp. A-GB1]|uniref:hypothetical protein n=1 Tax=Natronococcus sp. A-GB1 TaxID=3037648 RepID=UPI00241C6C48|nr:hypothetical protein [Natronococcus sp. A-GB1]MDG5760340.1 hypothetical protein [Natronococcus sp. A-GB1]
MALLETARGLLALQSGVRVALAARRNRYTATGTWARGGPRGAVPGGRTRG